MKSKKEKWTPEVIRREIALRDKPQHTPTPWPSGFTLKTSDLNGTLFSESRKTCIVRAVNCHEELLNQLKKNHEIWLNKNHSSVVCSTCKVIAKVEAK